MSRELIRDSISYLPAKVIPAIVGILSIPILTRLLPSEQYGQYVLAFTSLSLIYALCLSWLVSVTLRFYFVYGMHKLFNFSRRFFIYSLLLGWSLWVLVAMILGGVFVSVQFLITGILWIFAHGAFEYFLGLLRVRKQPIHYGLAQSWRSAGGLVMAVILLSAGFTGAAVVITAAVIVMLISLPILTRYALGVEKKEGVPRETEGFSPIILRYGMPAALTSLIITGLSILDRFVVDAYLGATALAIYGASYDLAEKTIFFVNSMLLLSSSVIGFRIFENNGEKKAIEFLSQLMRIYLLVALPIVMALIVFSSKIITLILPQQYVQGAVVVPFIALGGACVGVMHRYTLVLSFHKRTDLIMWCSGGALLVNLFSCWIMIPIIGIVGAAISTLVAYATWLFLMRLAVTKYQSPRFPWITFSRVVISLIMSGGVMYAILSAEHAIKPAALMAVFFLGIAIYIFGLLISGELTRCDIAAAAEAIRKKVHGS